MAPPSVRAAAGMVDWSTLGDRGLCAACLGRLFGKVAHGFTNPERGGAIREGRAGRDAPCGLCGGLMTEIPKFADLAATKLAAWDYRTFLVGSKVDPEVAAREEVLWDELGLSQGEPIKSEINREVGKLLAAKTGRDADLKHPDIAVHVDTQYDVVELDVAPLFVYGRYRKLARGIPQTPWPRKRCRGKGCERCGGKGKMYETSVEEIVATPLMAQVGGTGHAMHGMGREDVDARTLGNGRPFVLEGSGVGRERASRSGPRSGCPIAGRTLSASAS